MNKIEKVLDWVYSYDKRSIGLQAECFLPQGIDQYDFEQYAPPFQLRAELVAYDLAWIVYNMRHQDADPQTFKHFLKTDNCGIKLFNRCFEIAEQNIQRDLTFQTICKSSTNTSQRSFKNLLDWILTPIQRLF